MPTATKRRKWKRPLPMPYRKGARRCGAEEKQEYAERWHAQCALQPDYAARFNRPAGAVFTDAWRLVEKWLPQTVEVIQEDKRVQTPLELSDQEKVALVVLVDLFLDAAQTGRNVTYNDVFDEVCRKYSDHFVASPARQCRDMTPATVRNARRDLLRNNIDINKLWGLFRNVRLDGDPFFSIAASDSPNPARPLSVKLSAGSDFRAFMKVVQSSPQSFSSRSARVRLAFSEFRSSHKARHTLESAEYCAETPYNVVTLGPRSHDSIALQSRTELLFDADAFKSDMKELKKEYRILRQAILKTYQFDPRMPNHKTRSFRKVGSGGGWHANGKWQRTETWSRRERHIYFRSIAEGFRQDLNTPEITEQLRRKAEAIAKTDEKRRAERQAITAYRYTSFARWLIDHAAARISVDAAARSKTVAAAYEQQQLFDVIIAKRATGLKRIYAEQTALDINDPTPSSTEESASARKDKASKKGRPNGDAAPVHRGLKYLDSLSALPRAGQEHDYTPDVFARATIAGREWRQNVAADIARYDEIRTFVRLFSAVAAQVRTRSGLIPIYCRFVRSINRRYQPTDMWPTYVGDWNLLDGLTSTKANTYRKRWFKARHPSGQPCNLVGLDISSSQTQIIATLFADKKLEDATMESGAGKPPFKRVLADLAFAKDQDPNNGFRLRRGREGSQIRSYTGGGDPRLQELCKSLWMKVSYGSNAYVVVRDQAADPATYGPGWSVDDAQKFLDFLQSEFEGAKTFLDACQAIGQQLASEQTSDGCVFTDPSDGSEVRWNPIKRTDRLLKSDGHALTVSLPANRKTNSRFSQTLAARYKLDGNELKKMIAPCLIHMLDAYYSTLVMEKLAACGVTDVVGIHDCWLVPETVLFNRNFDSGLTALRHALKEAAAEWYRGLGPVYEGLGRYLKGDERFGNWISQAEARWKARSEAGYVPAFLAKID